MPRDFSQRFPEERAAFTRGITGLPGVQRASRASVVLHRLMFLYFLQQHGWLDGDPEYLARPLRNGGGSYYRRFLRPLLHEGLAQPRSDRRRDWGRIPYLGAGLLQTDAVDFDIADTAFRRLFAFFNDYRWSLDDATAAVQPALLGTLFEKHVNRRQTGTYYTPEDVTQYIAHYTILPVLLDTAFAPDAPLWQLLRQAPDRYIPDAVRHGVDEPLPRAAVADRNRPAAARFALPTESWREHQTRRRRCQQLRKRLTSGKITSVNDLVTHNLDLRRFVLDGIAGADRKLLRAVLAALEKITVLDPTCGSGAFLFAALNLLEEVWSACLKASSLDEPRPLGSGLPLPNGRGSCSLFRIRAAILQKNLYGVDLQEEAVELCRLRLLLRLIAAAKPGEELKELPDLGATIRAGDAIAQAFPEGLRAGSFDVVIGNPPYLPRKPPSPPVHRGRGAGGEGVFPQNPNPLTPTPLPRVQGRGAFRIDSDGFITADCPDIYARVLERAAALLRDGGRTGMIVPLSLAFSGAFDSCRRLLFATYGDNWFSSFARIPAALFAGDIRVRNTIHLGHKSREPGRQYTTRMYRWFEADRPQLFPRLEYTAFHPELWGHRVPRLNTPALTEAMERCLRNPRRLGEELSRRPTPHALYFKKTAYNWLTFCRRLPPCFDADGSPIAQTQFDVLYFADAARRDLAFLFLNGKWAFAYWCVVGDDFHAARWMFADLPVDLSSLPAAAVRRLRPLAGALERAMFEAVSFKRNAGKRVGTYNLARCRRVTDRSDRIFAEFLGLTDAWEDVELLYRQVVKTDFEV